MDAIENAAFVSVGRACGFAGLGLFCLMFGLSFEPPLAARAGGLVCLAITVVLAAYAAMARRRPYKRTELWLILAKDQRPPAAIAQQVIGQTLRITYLWFAQQTALMAIVLWFSALVLQYFEIGKGWADA